MCDERLKMEKLLAKVAEMDHLELMRQFNSHRRGNMDIYAILKFVRSVLQEKSTGRDDLFLLISLSLQEGYNMKKFIDSSSSQILHNAVKNFELKYTLNELSATMKKTALTPSRLRLIAPELTVKALLDETLKRPLPYKTVELAFGLREGLSYPKVLTDISVASLLYGLSESKEFIYSSVMCIFGYALIETVTFKSSRSSSLNEEVKKIIIFLMVSFKSGHDGHLGMDRKHHNIIGSLNQGELEEIAFSIEQYCKKNNFDSPSVEIKQKLRMQ